MRYLMDTNVVSELRKKSRSKCHPGVAAWIAGTPGTALFLSVLVLGASEGDRYLASHRPPRGEIHRSRRLACANRVDPQQLETWAEATP